MTNEDTQAFKELTSNEPTDSVGFAICRHWFATDPAGYMRHRAQEIIAARDGDALV